ncbi:MAG: twin-arginine translocation pathway signal protein [Betaproteobacteria bacterium]|nr:twin-arginine translocation pathway signal protein [Betaproteobacteria bacterium]
MSPDQTNKARKPGRRTALALIALAGSALAVRSLGARAQNRPQCVARPEQTEGPYFVDTQLARSDIRADPATSQVEPGVPLEVTFRVSRLAGACQPLSGAHVELWQCNASGTYSGVRDPHVDTTGRKFLRGYQATDANGTARFTTIYPGWYPGRTVHIHFMIRTAGSRGRGEQFTSQLYFDDALSDRIFARAPYAERGPRTVRNAGDGIYRRGGSQLMLAPTEQDGGLAATFDIALKASR